MGAGWANMGVYGCKLGVDGENMGCRLDGCRLGVDWVYIGV